MFDFTKKRQYQFEDESRRILELSWRTGLSVCSSVSDTHDEKSCLNKNTRASNRKAMCWKIKFSGFVVIDEHWQDTNYLSI